MKADRRRPGQSSPARKPKAGSPGPYDREPPYTSPRRREAPTRPPASAAKPARERRLSLAEGDWQVAHGGGGSGPRVADTRSGFVVGGMDGLVVGGMGEFAFGEP
ncbi:hypothetical protein GCM10025331_74160 [Actinoplanes utahensis]|nr:hypothetical protein Aut01nite_79660 [Actinoplanes utahensis]